MSGGAKLRVVRCPGCGGDSIYGEANPWRPFCSERCKNSDFGAWASEHYRVADPAAPGAADTPDDGDAPAPSRH